MLFCPKCGSILTSKKNKKGVLACGSCGFVQKEIENPKISETLAKKEEVAVIENEIDPNPLIDAECSKCGHPQARFWTAQTRASDEPETKFFRCEKCRHTWRDYN